MSKIKINKRTEYEMVIPTNTFGGEYRYKTDGEGYWEFHDSDCWVPLDDEKSLLLELTFQTHKGDIIEEPSDEVMVIGLDTVEDDKKLIEDGVVDEDYLERVPTKWFETEQISTYIGGFDEHGDPVSNGHSKLIVMHQCGKNKKVLIGQLEAMIDIIKTNGEGFAC